MPFPFWTPGGGDYGLDDLIGQGVLTPSVPPGFPTRAQIASGSLKPLAWASVFHRDPAGNAKTYPFAQVPIPDPASLFGGPKKAKVSSWGFATRALSELDGLVEGGRFSITVNDLPDRSGQMLLHGWLSNANQEAILNTEVACFWTTVKARKAGADPIVVHRGQIVDYEFLDDFQIMLVCQDRATLRLQEDLKLPRIGDAFPGAFSQYLNLRGRLLYGNHSDEAGTLNAPTVTLPLATDERHVTMEGLPIPHFAAQFTPIYTGEAPPPTVEQPGNVALELVPCDPGEGLPGPFGDPGYIAIVTANLGDGLNGAPDTYLNRPYTVPANALDVPTADMDNQIKVTWDDGSYGSPPALGWRVWFGWIRVGLVIYWTQYKDVPAGTYEATFTRMAYPWDAPPAPSNITPGALVPPTAQQFWYRVHSVNADGLSTESSPEILGDIQPFTRLIYIKWARDPAADSYVVYRRANGDPSWTKQLVVAQVDEGNIPVATDDGTAAVWTSIVSIDSVTPRGVVPCIPLGSFPDAVTGNHWSAYAIAAHACKAVYNLYLADLTTGAPRGYEPVTKVAEDRYGVDCLAPGKPGLDVFFPDADPYRVVSGREWTVVYFQFGTAVALDAGQLMLLANVGGIEAIGDGSGELLEDIDDQKVHFATNFWLGDTVWAGGPWLSIPVWADGTARIDLTRVEAAQLAALEAFEDNEGAWMVDQDVRVMDIWAQLQVNSGGAFGFSRTGQLLQFLDFEASEPVMHFTETRDITAKSWSLRDERGRDYFYNVRDVEALPIYGFEGIASYALGGQRRNAASQTAYGVKPTGKVSFFAKRHTQAAIDLAQRLVDKAAKPRRVVTFRTSLIALSIELGDTITVRHRQGAGVGGYQRQLMQVRKIELDLNTDSILLTCWDFRTQTVRLSATLTARPVLTSKLRKLPPPSDTNLLLLGDIMQIELGGSWYNPPAVIDSDPQIVDAYEFRDIQIPWQLFPPGTTATLRLYGRIDTGGSLALQVYDPANDVVILEDVDVITSDTFVLHEMDLPVDIVATTYRLRGTVTSGIGRQMQFHGNIRITLPS